MNNNIEFNKTTLAAKLEDTALGRVSGGADGTTYVLGDIVTFNVVEAQQFGQITMHPTVTKTGTVFGFEDGYYIIICEGEGYRVKPNSITGRA